MPTPQIKNESFENFGGINTKISPYQISNREFLDIRNMNFIQPGSLTKRPGSTQYINSSQVSGIIKGLYEMVRLDGTSMVLMAGASNVYLIRSPTCVSFQNNWANNRTDFVNFVDRTFFCNGQNFMKFDGLTMSIYNGASFNLSAATGPTTTIYDSFLYSLPVPGHTLINGISTWGAVSIGLFGFSPLINNSGPWFTTGTYTYSYAYVNDRGFIGPVKFGATAVIGASTAQVSLFDTIIPNLAGGTLAGFNIAPSYGIGCTNITSFAATHVAFGSTYSSIAIFRDDGSGNGRFLLGYAGSHYRSPNILSDLFIDKGPGGTYLYNSAPNLGAILSNIPEPTHIQPSYMPRYLEIYNNSLFMSGFSLFPSIIQFSEIGEPEQIEPTYNFEVRTNDGDRITGMRSYFSQLFLFKERSFHSLSGDSPDNFSVSQKSDQYGCLSHWAITTFEDKMLFLDRKGIVEYNGGNIRIISTPIEPIMRLINVSAARDQACMIHNRPRNEVWCAFPSNGATLNNVTIVYDYILSSWAIYDGFNPNVFAMIEQGFNEQTPLYGGYSGQVMNFGVSLFGDNGSGITCLAKYKFIGSPGESVQKIFRRLWTNLTPYSATTGVTVDFFVDYNGISSVLTKSLGATNFQERIELGLSAKSCAPQWSHFSSTDPFQLNGFVLSNRYLRDV